MRLSETKFRDLEHGEREVDLEIRPGLYAEKTIVVGPEHVAAHLGSGGVPVYATPSMILHIEETSRMVVEPLLDEGLSTVGASIQAEHLAPTPPGMTVRIRAELVRVEGRFLTFSVEVWDEVEKVGQASHVRAIIDLRRFSDKVARKAEAARKAAKTGAAATAGKTAPSAEVLEQNHDA